MHAKEVDELPSISILIAAYNEEKDIKETLENKLKLDYPREKLEISDEQRTQAIGELRGMREEFTNAGDDAEALAELYKKADEKIATLEKIESSWN